MAQAKPKAKANTFIVFTNELKKDKTDISTGLQQTAFTHTGAEGDCIKHD